MHQSSTGQSRSDNFGSEQRKDRNRLAQAAFRARRSKYTQSIEQTLLRLDKVVEELQESNRVANERAEKAEKTCAKLQAESQTLRHCLVIALADNRDLWREWPGSASLNAVTQYQQNQTSDPTTSTPICLDTGEFVSLGIR
ncbi:hypothetical protein DFQ30_007272 [Apophysomyces sp. BC1015]|nr:hypothetical protein DFQ30_007272 [Apophysomyces sp. BC1015]